MFYMILEAGRPLCIKVSTKFDTVHLNSGVMGL